MNCFSRIPQEIVDEIVMYLPTADALRCRLVSRTLSGTVSSQRFWASRFEPGGEYGFLFEVQPISKSARDWLSLYLYMKETNIPDILWNRKRIWKLHRLLVDILKLKWCGQGQQEPPDQDPFSVWEDVYGIEDAITKPSESWRCHVRRQYTPIITSPSKINVTVIDDGGAGFVAGIELLFKDGKQVSLGYKAPWQAISIDIDGFQGFVVSAGLGGIHAIQVIMGDGTPSKWLGNPSDHGVQTRRLVGDSICNLNACFDAYKLTELAVCKKRPSPPSRLFSCSRDNAWWYPRVPGPYTDLSFTSDYTDYNRHYVYSWVHFGGPGGVYLRSLIGISATFDTEPGTRLRSIEFSYSGSNVPDNCRRLGTCRNGEQIDFAIDGPGGERIEHIYLNHIAMLFMIETNKGRFCSFNGPGDKPYDCHFKPKRITIASGTSITGLYAAHNFYCGYYDFGVISEVTGKDN